MKKIIHLLLILVLFAGCSDKNKDYPILIGGQFLNCEIFVKNDIETPTGFSISPIQALEIVRTKTNYKCQGKVSGKVYVDKNHYYIVHGLSTGEYLDISDSLNKIRVVINGKTGHFWYLTDGSL